MTGPIVVGVDGSEGSNTALGWAIEAARRLPAPVTAVFGLSPWASVLFAVPPFDADESRKLLRTRFQEEWCAPLVEAGIKHEKRFVRESPASALLEAADQVGASVIALGSHGHSRWSPHLLGSVTAKVLHHASCPVVVVPHPPAQGSPSGRMVVGIDGSPASRRALRWAAARAPALGRYVQAVCVDPPQLWHEHPRFENGDGPNGLDLPVGLQKLVADVAATAGTVIEAKTLSGDPAEVLLGLSAESDLLVMGSRGHASTGEDTLGSLVRTCATRAICPVVIVPEADS